MTWTKEQQAAIDSRGQNLLLSAAAGSGKTAVLVERIIRRLLDHDDPVDITQLLVVTFTKAAAAEMRERIAAALAKALTGPEAAAAERQLALMPSAHISTLHSFCQAVIRRYFYKIDLDPQFVIAGTEELMLLQHTVLEHLFLSYYEDPEKAPVLYPLAEMFGDEHGDDALMGEIIRIYNFACSLPWPDEWLKQAVDNYDCAQDQNLDDLPWCAPLKAQIRRQLKGSSQQLQAILPELSSRPALSKGYAQIQQEYQMIARAAEAQTWNELRLAVQSVNYDRLVSLRKLDEDDRLCWDGCKQIRSLVKKRVDAIGTIYFSVASADWLDGLHHIRPYASGLVQLVRDFAQAYRKAKKEKSWVDFNDLERFCLQILLDPSSRPDHIVRSEAACELSQSFREILMDEYQDTNGVQEMIAQLIARQDNRFMVGDIKQSIYRFRLADPTLFLQKYLSYSREETAGRRCIDLAKNFRSDQNILAAVNQVFARVMTQDSAGMVYGEHERLYAGRSGCTDPRWLGGTVEVHLLDSSGMAETEAPDDQKEESAEAERTAFEKESILIARRLLDLKQSGLCIQRKNGTLAPVAWRDMVVLLRSLKNKTQILVQTFQAAGIPVYADESGGYFAAVEVQIMLSLLRCIDNPEQDLPLAAVLRSPLVGMGETALADLRLSGTDTLWQNLPAYIDTLPPDEAAPLQQFKEQLEQWRTFSRRNSVADLLQRLYQDTGYLQVAAGMPGGAVRQANLQALYERARQYEAAGYRGLFRYLQLLDKMRDDQLDLAPAKVLGEGEDVVRILSIHKSKGLEFPVVVAADMGKQFNERDLSRDVLLHKSLGIGLRQFDNEWRVSYPSFIWSGMQAQLAWEGRAEEQRVLYVAMTRARDKLILTGSVKGISRAWERWQQAGDPTAARSYWDWIMPLFAGNPEWAELNERARADLDSSWAQDIWEVSLQHTVPSLQAAETTDHEAPQLAALRRGELTGTRAPVWMERALSWHYAYPLAVRTAAKYSVTEIKRQYQLLHQNELAAAGELAAPGRGTETEEDVFAQLPPWLEEGAEAVTGTRRGTVTHKVMQYLDVQPGLTAEGLRQQLAVWQKDGMFTAEDVKLVYLPPVLAFCHSALGRRMAASSKVLREYPFTLLLPAGGLLPVAEDGEEILIQGVIDCLFQEKGEWILVDYKTDRLESEDAFSARYAVQLALYKKAVEQISSCPVKETYIYSFHLGKAIAIETGDIHHECI